MSRIFGHTWNWPVASVAVRKTLGRSFMQEVESDFLLSNLAAGPLEDLLVEFDDQFIDRIEKCASQSPRFRFMLSMVWKNDISEPVWERVRRASTVH